MVLLQGPRSDPVGLERVWTTDQLQPLVVPTKQLVGFETALQSSAVAKKTPSPLSTAVNVAVTVLCVVRGCTSKAVSLGALGPLVGGGVCPLQTALQAARLV